MEGMLGGRSLDRSRTHHVEILLCIKSKGKVA